MKRHLLDSNAVSDYVFRRRGVFEKAEFARSQGSMIGTCHAVVAELLAGIEYSSSRDVNMDRVNRTLSRFRIWPLTLQVAREYARLYASMRRSGATIQVVDLIAAATARTLGNCTVVSSDSDMGRVPGLNVENWATG